jgi:hypothetical protein
MRLHKMERRLTTGPFPSKRDDIERVERPLTVFLVFGWRASDSILGRTHHFAVPIVQLLLDVIAHAIPQQAEDGLVDDRVNQKLFVQ